MLFYIQLERQEDVMEETTVEVTEFTAFIFEGNIPKLTKDIEKLNKKAVKLGCDPIVLSSTGNTDFRPIDGDPRNKTKVLFVEVKLIGKSPKLLGWSLIACVDHDPAIGQTFRTVPNKEVPVQYLPDSSYCEHCHSDRRRLKTYIVKNIETGEYKRIGSTCVSSFLGGKHVESFLFYASFVSTMGDLEKEYSYNGCDRASYYYNLDLILAITSKIIAKFGYVSHAKANESDGELTSTASEVYWQFNTKNENPIRPTDDELAATQPMIEWAKGQDITAGSYMYNVTKIATAGMTNDRNMGVTVSIPTAYARAMDLISEKTQMRASEYVGDVGARLNLELLYTTSYVSAYQGFNGETIFFHKFVDRTGNHFTWKTATTINEVQTMWFTVRGTVASHKEYKGIKSTMLSRCVLKPVMKPLWKTEV
jgi:hypothetical protein